MYIEFSKVCSAFSAFVGLIFGFFLGAMGDGLGCRVSTSDEHERVRTLQAQSVEITAAQRACFQELGYGNCACVDAKGKTTKNPVLLRFKRNS